MMLVVKMFYVGAPYGTRTHVFAVRGRRPRPLDEGSENKKNKCVVLIFNLVIFVCGYYKQQ